MKTVRHSTVLPLILAVGLLLIPAGAMAGFTWDIEHTGSVNDFFEIEAFHTFVTNTGSLPDTVMVNMVKNMPGDWVASLCEELLCYPPFLLDIELILAPGQTTELIIDITPIAVQGKGSTLITLTSRNNPADTAAAEFAVISAGVEVLLVSRLDSAQNDALLTDAITAAGKTAAVWNPTVMGKAGAAELARFGTVVWAAGGNLLGIDAADMANLATFVDGGGSLLLSGQNLAFAYCDPGSPFFAAGAPAWFAGSLGVSYVANLGGTTTVSGTAGNPVFPGLNFALNGGDGSNNNISPDHIAATGNGVARLTYAGGGTALVLAGHAAGNTAFAAFGIESLATGVERSLFVSRIFAWFAGEASAVGDDLLPGLVLRPSVWPNPFNPQTTIRFEVGGDRPQPTTVTVHDVRGQVVRRLHDGALAPGARQLTWNSRDDRGHSLATGVYLARVQVGHQSQTLKMTLAK